MPDVLAESAHLADNRDHSRMGHRNCACRAGYNDLLINPTREQIEESDRTW